MLLQADESEIGSNSGRGSSSPGSSSSSSNGSAAAAAAAAAATAAAKAATAAAAAATTAAAAANAAAAAATAAAAAASKTGMLPFCRTRTSCWAFIVFQVEAMGVIASTKEFYVHTAWMSMGGDNYFKGVICVFELVQIGLIFNRGGSA